MDQGGTGMKKKKLISLLLAATCIGSMALTGCGEKEKGGGSPGALSGHMEERCQDATTQSHQGRLRRHGTFHLQTLSKSDD